MINIHPSLFKYQTITRFIVVGVYGLFCVGVYLNSHTLDVEYIGPDKRYAIERDAYNHTHEVSDWSREFPSFSDWMQIQEQRERDMKEWLGVQSLACFGTLEEYQRAEAEYSARMYPNLNRDADRAGPTAAECPQAMERKGPND